MSKEATIIQNFNAEKRKYEYFIKGYDVTKSIEILLKKHKEEYDKERRVFESTKGYLEAQQEYEKHIANLQSQLDQANERLKGAIISRYQIGTKLYMIPTEFNRLKGIKDYTLLSVSLSDIGVRYDLCLNKKEKSVEPFYCASEDMLGQSIFTTLEEAQAKLKELRGGE